MSFFRKRKKRSKPEREVEASSRVKHPKKRKVTPVEVKILAIDALRAGIAPSEVCDLVGVSSSALGKWRKLYQEVLHLHDCGNDWDKLQTEVTTWLDQFAKRSPDLLRYVGLCPD